MIDPTWVLDAFRDSHNDYDLCCLMNFAFNKGVLHLTYGKCQYVQSLATLLSPDRITHVGHHSLRHRLLEEQAVAGKSFCLPELSSTAITSHMGASAIVITRDRYPVVQHRVSRRLHSNINSLSASASGMVNWSDWTDRAEPLKAKDKAGNVMRIPAEELNGLFKGRSAGAALLPADRAIIRECIEEIALYPEHILDIRLVGIAREFRRPGKPEFFYLIHTNWLLSDLVAHASIHATHDWEHDDTLSRGSLQQIPAAKQIQAFYFGELLADSRFNEITKLAFYFVSRSFASDE